MNKKIKNLILEFALRVLTLIGIALVMAMFIATMFTFLSFKSPTVEVVATIYHAVPEQTNEDFLTTASLKKINPENPEGHRWIAVSRDLEKKGLIMGTRVCVEGADELDGYWTVEDRMNKRWTNRIDFLVNLERKGGKWENVKVYME
jgi:3D (Asp-Asp-Asp) domain-containing protein